MTSCEENVVSNDKKVSVDIKSSHVSRSVSMKNVLVNDVAVEAYVEVRMPLVYGVVVETVKESIEVENGLFDHVVVGSVKELVEGNSGLGDDQLFASDLNQDGFSEVTNVGKRVIEYIETHDVLNSESFEIIKSGIEKLIRNGIRNMKGKVGVGDFQLNTCFIQGYTRF